MEARNIALTLKKAREWYNSGSSDLKEVALQAYTEEELTIPDFTEIKDFWSAVRTLGLNRCSVQDDLSRFITAYGFEGDTISHLRAIYKLDIIRKALNKGWNPKMTEDTVYYPHVQFYPAGNKAKEAARNNGWDVKETFKADGEEYSLIGGDYNSCCVGLGTFGYGFGDVKACPGLLGCKSREIAQHMSRYFAKEIFEACYTHHIGTYKWV